MEKNDQSDTQNSDSRGYDALGMSPPDVLIPAKVEDLNKISEVTSSPIDAAADVVQKKILADEVKKIADEAIKANERDIKTADVKIRNAEGQVKLGEELEASTKDQIKNLEVESTNLQEQIEERTADREGSEKAMADASDLNMQERRALHRDENLEIEVVESKYSAELRELAKREKSDVAKARDNLDASLAQMESVFRQNTNDIATNKNIIDEGFSSIANPALVESQKIAYQEQVSQDEYARDLTLGAYAKEIQKTPVEDIKDKYAAERERIKTNRTIEIAAIEKNYNDKVAVADKQFDEVLAAEAIKGEEASKALVALEIKKTDVDARLDIKRSEYADIKAKIELSQEMTESLKQGLEELQKSLEANKETFTMASEAMAMAVEAGGDAMASLDQFDKLMDNRLQALEMTGLEITIDLTESHENKIQELRDDAKKRRDEIDAAHEKREAKITEMFSKRHGVEIDAAGNIKMNLRSLSKLSKLEGPLNEVGVRLAKADELKDLALDNVDLDYGNMHATLERDHEQELAQFQTKYNEARKTLEQAKETVRFIQETAKNAFASTEAVATQTPEKKQTIKNFIKSAVGFVQKIIRG